MVEPWLTIAAVVGFVLFIPTFFLASSGAMAGSLFLVVMWTCGLATVSRMFSPAVTIDGREPISRMRRAPVLMRRWNLFGLTLWWVFLGWFTIWFVLIGVHGEWHRYG